MPKFELGQVVATPGALQAIRSSGQTPSQFLRRHVNGDWGEHLDGHDYKQNQIALREGGRLLSADRIRTLVVDALNTGTQTLFGAILTLIPGGNTLTGIISGLPEQIRTTLKNLLVTVMTKVAKPVTDRVSTGLKDNPAGVQPLTPPVKLNKAPGKMGWLGKKNGVVHVYVTGSEARPQPNENPIVKDLVGEKARLIETANTQVQKQVEVEKKAKAPKPPKPTKSAKAGGATTPTAAKKPAGLSAETNRLNMAVSAAVKVIQEQLEPVGCAIKGKCFRPGTLTRRFGPRGVVATAIEDMRLGQNVPTWLCGEWGHAESVATPGTVFAPGTHRAVRLRQERADGNWCEADLLRSREWMALHGITKTGDRIILDLPEMGASGGFQVLAIEPCPEIEDGDGRTVTGVFRHGQGRVYNVWVEGEPQPLGATGQHPFWSADRLAWVPTNELNVGERVQAEGRTVKVLKVEPCGEEPVFNLEVDADHCYRVGEQGILVHNASAHHQKHTDDSLHDSLVRHCINYDNILEYFNHTAAASTTLQIAAGPNVVNGALPLDTRLWNGATLFLVTEKDDYKSYMPDGKLFAQVIAINLPDEPDLTIAAALRPELE